MRLTDGEADFGWISIGLHWIGALLVVAMLVIGTSINDPKLGLQDGMLRLHTTIGLGFYAVLWLRVVWRFRAGHPAPLPRQGRFFYAVGRYFHYLLLIALGAMLISGPVMAWTGNLPLRIGSLTFWDPFGVDPGAFQLARMIHIGAATVLGWGTLLHIGAVIKHTVIDRDGALDKIMAPARRPR